MPNVPATWRATQTVNITQGNAQSSAQVVQLANGNILVVWTSADGSGAGAPAGTDIIGRIYDPLGNSLTQEFRLNSGSTADNEMSPSIAPTPTGGFIIVYHDLDLGGNGGSNIRLEEYDILGSLLPHGGIVRNDSGNDTGPNYANPEVAVSGLTALVIYEELNGGSTTAVGRFYNFVTHLYGPEFDLFGGSAATGDPQIVTLANGNFVVVADLGGPDSGIVYRVFSDLGLAITGATVVQGTNSDGFADSGASIAALSGGGFVIAWSSNDATDTDILYRTFTSAGTQFGAGSAGPDSAANANTAPTVAGLASGGFAIVYTNGVTNALETANFAANGTALGSVSFTGSAGGADAIGLADGRFAIVSTLAGSGNVVLDFLDPRDVINGGGITSPAGLMVGMITGETIVADGLATSVHGWDGSDTITQGLGALATLFGDAGDDTIAVTTIIDGDGFDGGDGIDTANWSGSLLEFGGLYNLAAGVATSLLGLTETMAGFESFVGTPNQDTVIGTSGDNTLRGGAGNDYIIGGDGNDTLYGDGGVNTLQGGFGDDIYYITQTREDTILEFAHQGNDEVRTTFSVYALQDHLERLTFIDDADHGAGVGNSLDNVITGALGVDALFGRAGNDVLRGGTGAANTLYGQAGDDRIIVEAVGDTVIEDFGEGTDTVETALASFVLRDNVEDLIYTGSGSFTGIGAAENNAITGGANADFLSGLDGADTLTGGSDSDLLLGGAGSDSFRYNGGETGLDRILDFASGQDRIALALSGFTRTATVDLVQGSSPVAAGANSAFLYDSTTGILSYDADGAGGAAAVQLAQLNAGLTLTTGDFVFV